MKKVINNVSLSYTLIALCIIDIITTKIGMAYGCTEANYVMKPFVENTVLLASIKLVVTTLILYRLYI